MQDQWNPLEDTDGDEGCRCNWEGLQERIPWQTFRAWWFEGDIHGPNRKRGIPAMPQWRRLNRITNEISDDCQDNELDGVSRV